MATMSGRYNAPCDIANTKTHEDYSRCERLLREAADLCTGHHIEPPMQRNGARCAHVVRDHGQRERESNSLTSKLVFARMY